MPKFDKHTGKLIDPNAPEVPNTVANGVPELNQEPEPQPEVAEPAPQPVGITMEQLMAILTKLKEPNEVEQFRYEQEKKKLDQEQANRLRLAERARENAERADRIRYEGQSICGHVKENGTTAWAGQVNSDGNTRFVCVRCGKVMPPVKAPDEWKTGGINTQMGADVAGAMRFINERMIFQWHRSTHPNCKDRCCVRQAVTA